MQNIAKKIIPYLLILIALVGLFGLAEKADAQTDPLGTCRLTVTTGTTVEIIRATDTECRAKANYQSWKESTDAEYQAAVAANTEAGTDKDPTGTCLSVAGKVIGEMTEKKCKTENIGASWTTNKPSSGSDETKNPLKDALKSCDGIDNWSFDGCMQKIFYTIFYTLPAFLLGVTANFFNIILGLTLKGRLLESEFVSSAWGIVRDLSNIFFILILLYVSIKIILDLGSHEAKQTIVNIIIIALLINFSMFFAKVVIDTSNVLALVFYNKLEVTTTVNGTEKSYIPGTRENEKNVSGSMAGAFDVTKFISEDFFDTLKERVVVVPSKVQIAGAVVFPVYGGYLAYNTIKNYFVPQEEVPMAIILSIILIAGAVMIFAIYAFLVAGLSFLARIIELWVLIIFSPFAFMSFTIPELKKISYIGWDAWISRLLTTSFKAPIFMFFMYFIFLLIKSNIFKDMIVPDENRTVWASILFLVLPALFILILLLQATKFAKKGAGTIGEMVMTGAKIAGGLALGAATGGASMVGTATLGRAGAAVANSERAKKWEAEGKFGAGLLRSGAKSMGSASFDMRGVKIAGKTLGSATGMSVGNAKTGGFVERRKEQIAKRQKRAEELKMGENTEEKLKLNTAEEKLKRVKLQFEPDLEKFDKAIAAAREDLNDAKNSGDLGALEKAKKELADAKNGKKALREREGKDGISLKEAEDNVHHMTYNIKVKNAERTEEYAKLQESAGERVKGFILSGGIYTKEEAREVAHKIRMEAKIEEGGGKKGHDDGGHAPAAAHAPKPASTPKASTPAKSGGDDHGHAGH